MVKSALAWLALVASSRRAIDRARWHVGRDGDKNRWLSCLHSGSPNHLGQTLPRVIASSSLRNFKLIFRSFDGYTMNQA